MKVVPIKCPWCSRHRLPSVLKCQNPACPGPTVKETLSVKKPTVRKNQTVERPIETLTRKRKRDRMTQVERRWANEHPGHTFECCTWHLACGHSYTPDFYDAANALFIEVKGGYKLHSHSRAQIAFDMARREHPEFQWAWWTWTGTQWEQRELKELI